MRLPGLAWLEFRVVPEADGARLVQRAVFHPRGLAGYAYWYMIAPFHGVVFGGMIRNLAGAAEQPEQSDSGHRPGGRRQRRRNLFVSRRG